MKTKSELLRNYLKTHVRDIYKGFDDCHDQRHFDEVYYFMDSICNHLNYTKFEIDKMLTAAAFHDVGRIIDDEHHEEFSAQAVRRDKFIQHYFADQTIDEISEIILSHRSSVIASNEEQMILKDADKCARLNEDRQLYRLIAYNVHHNPNFNNLEIYNKIKDVITTRSKFTTGWLHPKSSIIFGELKLFTLPEFTIVSKLIDKYRMENDNFIQ